MGAKTAGYDLAWGVELRPDIAEVANANLGQHVIAANILDLDPADFDPVDLLHASPPCPSFSTAKTNGEETGLDIALAQKTADFVAVRRPRVFTLENVYAYRDSKSWAIIAETLTRHGYRFNNWHVNSADYGVPQTRKRMIVVARLDGRTPSLPPATHAENPVPGLFGTLERWVGWYAAIEDLIPTLPDIQFAPWQLDRLPEEGRMVLLESANKTSSRALDATEPAMTVERYRKSARPRAVLVDSAGYPDADGRTPVMRDEGDPANVVVSNHERRPMRAALVDFANSGRDATVLGEDDPSMTVQVWHGRRPSQVPAAFIVDGKLSKSGDERALQIHPEDEPVGTVVSAHSAMRDGRAFTGYRVVKMTTRALARFQGFPDWYSLPAHKTLRGLTGAVLVPVAEETEKNVDGRLATTIIGNAVPPLLYQKLAEYIAETAL